MNDFDALADQQFAHWWTETGEHELRQVLYWRRDPLGVSDAFPNTADEYDRYAPQIVSALRAGAAEDDIAKILRTIEREQMGLSHVPTERLGTSRCRYGRQGRRLWRDPVTEKLLAASR